MRLLLLDLLAPALEHCQLRLPDLQALRLLPAYFLQCPASYIAVSPPATQAGSWALTFDAPTVLFTLFSFLSPGILVHTSW